MQKSGNRLLLGVGVGSEIGVQLHAKYFEKRLEKFNSDLETLKLWSSFGEVDEHSISPWHALEVGPPLAHGAWGYSGGRAAKKFMRRLHQVCI